MTNSTRLLTEIRARLDELFKLRVALAEHDTGRDAAILRALPPVLQEHVAGIMQEYQSMRDSLTSAEKELDALVKTAVRTFGAPVKSTHLQASYAAGRPSWDHERLLELTTRDAAVKGCLLKIGEPVVSIRVVSQRQRTTPLLYDRHI